MCDEEQRGAHNRCCGFRADLVAFFASRKMAAHAPAPIFDYLAMGQARCRATSAVLLVADGRSTVDEVGECVAAELELARLALDAATAANHTDTADDEDTAAHALRAEVADRAGADPATPEAVPAWAAELTASFASVTNTVASLTNTVASLTNTVESLTKTVDSLTKTVDSLAKTFNNFALKTEARFANAQIENLSQRLLWIPTPADEPLPPGLPTTTAGLMALPRENIAVLLRLYHQRADSGWAEATLKKRICRYLGLAQKLAPEN
jgi:archaellum component FlaC